MSTDLFKAILSMDAYNRGYGSGINLTGTSIGNVTISKDSSILLGEAGNDTIYGGAGNDTINTGTGTNTVYAGAGNDTITGGTGIDTLFGGDGNDTITANAGNDTLDGGAGIDTLNGSTGNDAYIFGLGYGADTISDYDTTTGNSDILNFSSGISDQQLWFAQSGSNLVITVLGTTDRVTVSNFYTSTAYRVESFHSADGYTLDNQLSQLVSAMATYTTNNPGFDPVTATSMPTDTVLQSAIAASWHT